MINAGSFLLESWHMKEMPVITLSIQYFTEGPKQCNKAIKLKEYWKGTNKSVL